MSRWGGGREDYGDIPQRWDRDRFERFGAPRAPPPPGPPRGFHEDYHYQERDTPYRRDVAVADRIDDRGPRGSFQERDRYWEEDRYASPPAAIPGRSRRRTDRELFGDVDPRELAGMALVPARRKSVSRPDIDIDIDIDRHAAPPRPGLLRRQSSLDTFDRRPQRYEREERDYRIPPYTPVPLPIRRQEREYERAPYRDYEPEDYREVEIQRERSVHRRGPPKSEALRSVRSSRPKSVTTRRTSPSSISSESFEEIEKVESIHDSIAASVPRFKKGKTRMPKRLVMREAIQDLGYPYDEEEDFYVLRIAMEKEQIDEVIKISEQYKAGGETLQVLLCFYSRSTTNDRCRREESLQVRGEDRRNRPSCTPAPYRRARRSPTYRMGQPAHDRLRQPPPLRPRPFPQLPQRHNQTLTLSRSFPPPLLPRHHLPRTPNHH